MNATSTYRQIEKITQGISTSDGAGVKLTRIIGQPELDDLDPFLMLDRFESNNPNDYIGGFPPHPHRGFETVTYLLKGKMRHKDNQGHSGIIETGGVQWMTAGRGIIHSEMPEQSNGLLKGFQLWVNLPAEQKMVAPSYQEFSATEIPTECRVQAEINVIAGQTSMGTTGPVINNYISPLMLDVQLDKGGIFSEPAAHGDKMFIIMISGEIAFAPQLQTTLKTNQLAVLSAGDLVSVTSLMDNTQFLLVSAQPLNEPVVKGGPFVMNTEAEVQQAFLDYRNGLF